MTYTERHRAAFLHIAGQIKEGIASFQIGAELDVLLMAIQDGYVQHQDGWLHLTQTGRELAGSTEKNQAA